MSRRIDIELTSSREDGSWTWRAAGAREPKGTVDGAILPSGAEVGQVLRAEVEGFLDGLNVVSVAPPRAPRSEPQRLELKSSGGADQPLVTSTLAPKRSGERGRRNDRGRDRDREGGRRDRRGGRDRQDARHDRPSRPAPPPVEEKPKPKRLRPARTHRNALLEAVPAEQRPIAEQLLAGGIPAVRQAIDKQNEELKAEGKPAVKPDALLKVAEDLRPRVSAAVWRDRAEAAVASVDDLDLRDLRSVVNAAGDAGRDDEARALAARLRDALAERVEKEHTAWLTELAETVTAGRVVRALRLSSRPPKAGAPIPGDIATQLAEATAASLTDETGPDRWATVLDALAYSPVRRRVIPQSLPGRLTPDLRATIARLASRLPEIAHIFDIEPDPAAERAARGQARRRPGRKGDERKGDRKADDRSGKPRSQSGKRRGDKADKPEAKPRSDAEPQAEAKTRSDAEPQAEAKTRSDAEPQAEAKTRSDAEPVGQAEATGEAGDKAEVQAAGVEAPEAQSPEVDAKADTPAEPTAAGEPTPGSEAPEPTSPAEPTAPAVEATAPAVEVPAQTAASTTEATPSPGEAPTDASATEQSTATEQSAGAPEAEAEAAPEAGSGEARAADEPGADAETPAQRDVTADS